MINTKPILGDMRLNVTDNLGKHEVFNGETWLIIENYDTIESLRAEIETLKKDNKELHAIAQRMAMAESDARKSLQWFKDARERQSEPDCWIEKEDGTRLGLYTHPAKTLTDEEINVVAILQDAEIVPVGHEIWKTGEEFNKYKKIVLATAKALRKAQEK